MDFTEEQLNTIGRAMAIEAYKLEHTDVLATKEAMLLLGYKSKKTLYNNKIPHNQFGWSKKAILELMSR